MRKAGLGSGTGGKWIGRREQGSEESGRWEMWDWQGLAATKLKNTQGYEETAR